MTEQRTWQRGSHVAGVETFYGHGAENFGEFHGGYLNFGLWEPGMDYLAAAENLVLMLGRKLGLDAGSRLLDVAVGMGPQDILLHKTFGCDIDAVDATWKHLPHFQRRIDQAGFHGRVRPHHGDATQLPFEAGIFTHALCVEGAEHFHTREKFLREAFRTLKPGGKIVLADYAMTFLPTTWFKKFVVDMTAKLWHVPKENYETVASFKTRLEACGFTDVHVETVGAKTIPPYVAEARTKESQAAQSKIRGWLVTKLAWWVDEFLLQAFNRGLIEYVIVEGTKAA
jgi:ubiquinone/menaquinone biosynthesis C-methylase UbiE